MHNPINHRIVWSLIFSLLAEAQLCQARPELVRTSFWSLQRSGFAYDVVVTVVGRTNSERVYSIAQRSQDRTSYRFASRSCLAHKIRKRQRRWRGSGSTSTLAVSLSAFVAAPCQAKYGGKATSGNIYKLWMHTEMANIKDSYGHSRR